MKPTSLILAQVDTNVSDAQPANQLVATRRFDEVTIFVAVLVAITLLVFLFAYLLHRKHRRRGLLRTPHPPSFAQIHSPDGASASPPRHRHRRRHRHRKEHRPRNPTLAETGGLPPIRPEDQPPPPK
ncbi:MAG: hypothetical protein HY298_17885 [Verrucomicrobia bacterium]|nr:hypothetical protein [Verrucomicrobiota bacterium]